MKTATNCDATFERLTAGPLDPNDESTQEIQAHLQECDSCRAIADALRPALHLIHEALPKEERARLPGYAPDDGRTEEIMQQIRTASPTDIARKQVGFHGATSLWWIVACAAAVIAISWFQTLAMDLQTQTVTTSLASMELPSVCHEDNFGSDDDATQRSSFECCTTCHTSNSDIQIAKGSIQRILLACQQCHDQVVDHALAP